MQQCSCYIFLELRHVLPFQQREKDLNMSKIMQKADKI